MCPTRRRLSACCASQLRPGDVVLVKASRSVGLERVAQALLEGVAGAEGEVSAR